LYLCQYLQNFNRLLNHRTYAFPIFSNGYGNNFYYFFNISTISKYFKPNKIEKLKCLKLVFRHFYLIRNRYFKCELSYVEKNKLQKLIKKKKTVELNSTSNFSQNNLCTRGYYIKFLKNV